MNKTELMETYTAEQLAEMVVELQNEKENKAFKVKDNKNYQKEIENFFRNSVDKICKDIVEQKNNAMAMEFTRIIGGLLRENGVLVRFKQVEIGEDIHHNIIERKYGIAFDSMDFSQHDKEFTDKIEELQSETEKYRKAFEDAKNERDCQIAEYQKKIDELEQKLKRQETSTKYAEEYVDTLKNELKDLEIKIEEEYKPLEIDAERLRKNERELSEENAELYSEIEKSGSVSDFLPAEPIKVADMLINATYTREKGDMEKVFHKAFGNDSDTVEENLFDISELRQIAKHLLVYCNHNGEAEE